LRCFAQSFDNSSSPTVICLKKIDYYNSHTQEALDIISNAQKHVAQFFDHNRERLISLLVLKKYFELSGQM
jgi:hypothetical protein